ncbi:MAG: SDR family NAD(P)-dependent oxidoreductase [Candidatus Wildermuthbacteria bacterium]|nr:SDR family NAD(P)-dependent oxidoreductase [Candidatus Wildermuthbacteria bacterium]
MESMEINLKDKTVLVTGGAGFIGSHVVDRLVEEGARVVVLDNLSSGSKENLNSKAIFYQADVRDIQEVRDIIQKEAPSAVFHLAAQPLVETAYENPLETLEVNFMGTVHVLEACRAQEGIEAIVVVSSDKAYGKSKILPYTEDMPVGGDHPYEVSKAAGDLAAQSYFKTYGMPVTIARFGNTFGPRDRNWGRIIPDCFQAILKNKELVIRSDGKMVREYVYAKDVAEACLKLAQHIENSKGEAFNFGSDNILSVFEVVQEIEKILEVKIPYNILNTAKNEIPKQYLDWSKAKRLLAWQQKYTFAQGIRESFEWYKK